MEQSKARKVEAHKLSRKIAAHFFPDEDTKVFMHGHNRGWCNFDEVVEIVAQIIADHAPAETTKDATSGARVCPKCLQTVRGNHPGCTSINWQQAARLRPDEAHQFDPPTPESPVPIGDATSAQGEQGGQGVEIVAGMDSGGAVEHLDNTAIHPRRSDPDHRKTQAGGAVEQAGAARKFLESRLEPDPNSPDSDTFMLHFPRGTELVEGRQFWAGHLAVLLAEFAESELSALRRENAELQQSLKDEESASLDVFLKIEKLQAECAELRRKVEGK